GSPRPRVRFGADQQAVTAAGVHRVAHDRLHVVLVADVHQARRTEAFGDQGAEVQLGGRHAGDPSGLGDTAAEQVRVLLVAHAVDLDGLPVDRHTVAAVGTDLLDVAADTFPGLRIGQPVERGLQPALGGPAGQQRGQIGGAGQVRVGVERDVHAVGDRV